MIYQPLADTPTNRTKLIMFCDAIAAQLIHDYPQYSYQIEVLSNPHDWHFVPKPNSFEYEYRPPYIKLLDGFWTK